jgi:hypothetical protein
MPKKHPNTVRWGGPGASHENRSKPMPEPGPAHPLGATGTNPRVSQVSGGGGERDEKHSHVDSMRSSKSHATDSASPTNPEDWRRNRSRHDRQADQAVRAALGEQRSFRNRAHHDAAPDAGDGMPVRVIFDGDTPAPAVVEAEAERLVRRAVARFDGQLSEIVIYLTDNGGHGTAATKRCTIQAMPHRGMPVAASDTEGDMQKAITKAALELCRRLAEAMEGGGAAAGGEAAPRA